MIQIMQVLPLQAKEKDKKKEGKEKESWKRRRGEEEETAKKETAFRHFSKPPSAEENFFLFNAKYYSTNSKLLYTLCTC